MICPQLCPPLRQQQQQQQQLPLCSISDVRTTLLTPQRKVIDNSLSAFLGDRLLRQTDICSSTYYVPPVHELSVPAVRVYLSLSVPYCLNCRKPVRVQQCAADGCHRSPALASNPTSFREMPQDFPAAASTGGPFKCEATDETKFSCDCRTVPAAVFNFSAYSLL